jgi:hypothetical protein
MTVLLVVAGRSEVLLGHVDAPTADLALVDLLLRLRLDAGRQGADLRLRDVPAALRELVELAGVAELLGLEPGREAELGEHGRGEEVVQSRDPPG